MKSPILCFLMLVLSLTMLSAQEHQVKSGESLSSIARRYDITVEELKDWNNLSSDMLMVDQILQLPSQREYIVEAGDTLSEIAITMGVSLDMLMAANGLSNHHIQVGQHLIRPGTTISLPLREYQVEQGDTLWDIAQRFQVSLESLSRANDLEEDRILPGMTLRLPLGSTTGQQLAMIFYETLDEEQDKGPWFNQEPNAHRQLSLHYGEEAPESPWASYQQARQVYQQFQRSVTAQGRLSRDLRGWTIVIDPGHGGLDPGAIVETRDGQGNSSYVVEDEYAYDISMRLAALLMQHGAEVDLTILSPNHHIRSTPDASASFVNQKNEVFNSRQINQADSYASWPRGGREALQRRKQIAQAIFGSQSRRTLFISIHCDNTPSVSYDSALLYWGANPSEMEASEELAMAFAPHMGGEVRVREQELEVLRNNPASAAVLVEVRNLAHSENSWILRQEELRNQEVQRIFQGIHSYIGP